MVNTLRILIIVTHIFYANLGIYMMDLDHIPHYNSIISLVMSLLSLSNIL